MQKHPAERQPAVSKCARGAGRHRLAVFALAGTGLVLVHGHTLHMGIVAYAQKHGCIVPAVQGCDFGLRFMQCLADFLKMGELIEVLQLIVKAFAIKFIAILDKLKQRYPCSIGGQGYGGRSLRALQQKTSPHVSAIRHDRFTGRFGRTWFLGITAFLPCSYHGAGGKGRGNVRHLERLHGVFADRAEHFTQTILHTPFRIREEGIFERSMA